VDDPCATLGYNIYRAQDYPVNWIKLNATPWRGHFYRDMSALEVVTYTVQPGDWLEQGTLGRWGFHIPDFPYSNIVVGRPVLAGVEDVTVTCSVSGQPNIDGQTFRPVKVDATDRAVWLQMDNTIAGGGSVNALPLASAGQVLAANYSNFTLFQATYKKLVNYVDIYTSLVRTYYTIVPVGAEGEMHVPGHPGTTVVNTQEVDKITWEYQEMVRRNQWLFEEVGEPAFLFFKLNRGERCGCLFGTEEPKHGCTSCYETGWVGGYLGPYDFIFVPPDTALMRELNEGGIKTTRDSRAYLGPTPIVQNGDLIIRRNGERLVINNVVYKNPRGILLQQDFTVSLLPEGDTRYLIPEVNTVLPTIYNPVVHHNPLNGKQDGEPVFDPRTVPGKDWENPNIPLGRTVTFGKIQT
jgi:hypothetical protein